jgi:hypothetical protein
MKPRVSGKKSPDYKNRGFFMPKVVVTHLGVELHFGYKNPINRGDMPNGSIVLGAESLFDGIVRHLIPHDPIQLMESTLIGRIKSTTISDSKFSLHRS